jgi:hypothetical protein
MIVFDGKLGMRKFGSAAPPFSKVACAVVLFFLVSFFKSIYSRG